MAHLEDLLAEYYDWRGYVVKRNVKVGRRALGGWDMELDVVAYDPHTNHLVHLEPSLDAHSWEKREKRFAKKFSAGEQFIFSEVFTWLDAGTPIDQIAVLPRHPKGRDTLAGAHLQSVDELVEEICIRCINGRFPCRGIRIMIPERSLRRHSARATRLRSHQLTSPAAAR